MTNADPPAYKVLSMAEADHCSEGCMDFFLSVIGMVMIIEGLPYFAFPEKMKHYVRLVLEMPEGAMRKFGFALMLGGLLMVYIAKT